MAGSFWGRHAFSIGGVDFSWHDVVLAAMVRGEWSAFERRLAEGLACDARARADDVLPSEEAIDEAATAFRYDRDLIAAADVTAWLDRLALSADEWGDYLRRDLLRRQVSNDLDDVLDRFAPSARNLVEAAVVDGICSGAFDAFEHAFAGRAALVFDTDAARFRRVCEQCAAAASPDPLVAQLAHTHAHWLSIGDAGTATARLSLVSELDAAFSTIADHIAANGQLHSIIDDNRLEWMRLELETISFATESAAREAMLCMQVDGLSLHDVGALARRAVDRTVVALEDIDPQRRERLISAEPGHAVGPMTVDGRFDVALLVSRTAPALSEPVIAARARALAVDRALRSAARDHVTRQTGSVPA